MAFQQEYFSIPPITRAYTTTCLLTTIAVVSFLSKSYNRFVEFQVFFFFQQLEFVTAYQLYFNPELIFKKFQVIKKTEMN